MNFWRNGVGLECMFFIPRSLELRALHYVVNRPPRAAASFNQPAAPNRRPRFAFVAFFMSSHSFCGHRSSPAAVGEPGRHYYTTTEPRHVSWVHILTTTLSNTSPTSRLHCKTCGSV